jgi:hypothetical protein
VCDGVHYSRVACAGVAHYWWTVRLRGPGNTVGKLPAHLSVLISHLSYLTSHISHFTSLASPFLASHLSSHITSLSTPQLTSGLRHILRAQALRPRRIAPLHRRGGHTGALAAGVRPRHRRTTGAEAREPPGARRRQRQHTRDGGAAAGLPGLPGQRGLHLSTFRLNVSAFCGIECIYGVFRGYLQGNKGGIWWGSRKCSGRDKGMSGG